MAASKARLLFTANAVSAENVKDGEKSGLEQSLSSCECNLMVSFIWKSRGLQIDWSCMRE